LLPDNIIPLSETTVLTSLRFRNIFVGWPVPIEMKFGVAAEIKTGELGYGFPLPSVIVTKKGVVSGVDK
jgi:hypothetical protein